MENNSAMTVREDKSRSIQFFHQHLLHKEQKEGSNICRTPDREFRSTYQGPCYF